MSLFDALGFAWNRSSIPTSVPTYSMARVCFRFHKMLPEFVWEAGVLEGNPFTFPEVKTLLDGITVGGRKVSDQEQILNLAESSMLEKGEQTTISRGACAPRITAELSPRQGQKGPEFSIAAGPRPGAIQPTRGVASLERVFVWR